MQRMLRLPETLAKWPLPRRISPFYHNIAPQSADWLRGFNAFSADAQEAFDKCNFGLLAALAYPTADEAHYRTACDLMNLFFVFDEYTDTLNEVKSRELADISMDALREPLKRRPTNESVIGEVTRQFWISAIRYANETPRVRFEDTWDQFTTAVVEQAKDRDEDRLRTIEEHMKIRRLTIGAEPCYALAELVLELPREVLEHPLLKSLRNAITDIIIFDNDMASYNKEQAANDASHNLITIAMYQYKLNLDGAVTWLAEQHKAQVQQALRLWPQALALSFSREIDKNLQFYIDHLMNWPRANDCWNFENGRYFGDYGLRIQKERLVELLPGAHDRWRLHSTS
ncbi:terpenoid synthase [Daedaleopsis nitida]|nr:terpenoid synthase [Daedaleopsis nitida]